MTLEEERQRFEQEKGKYDRLVRLARRVHQPAIVPLWNIQVSRNGSISVDRWSFAHSWTRNFYNGHTSYSFMHVYNSDWTGINTDYAEGGIALKDPAVNVNSQGLWLTAQPEPAASGGGYGAVAAEGTSQGAVVGTGTTATSFDDYAVEGLVADGSAAGQMDTDDSVLVKGWDAGDGYYYAQWSRTFDNNSGGTITVGNMAMYFETGQGLWCFIRDVLNPTQAVLNGETLTYNAEFRMYFP